MCLLKLRGWGLEEVDMTRASLIHCMAAYLDLEGRWEEAETWNMTALRMRKSKLGADHPSTLTAMNNLAHTLKGMEKTSEAIELMSLCVALQLIKLGVGHPHTRSSISTLSSWKSG